MKEKSIIQAYKKDSCYSYTAGSYATIELLSARPEQAEAVYIHSDCRDTGRITELCRERSVPVVYNDRAFRIINQKENTYVLGRFSKYPGRLSPDKPHVVLVNPGDMGNLGTVIRTLAGFNLTNLAVITPAADIWHPKTIRASMGALFRLEAEVFTSFEQYRARYPTHTLYPFMLDGATRLTAANCPRDTRYALVFGNEATGLPDSFRPIGKSVKLAQSALVDSLNLSVAVGIGAFLFANGNGQI